MCKSDKDEFDWFTKPTPYEHKERVKDLLDTLKAEGKVTDYELIDVNAAQMLHV